MCAFNITDKTSKKIIPCTSAWDIFDTVLRLTKDQCEASLSWKNAGRLKIGKIMTGNGYTIKRVT